MPPPMPDSPRLRNAAATRQAMLIAARRHFARESYENVGLREIAGDAGVDPSLVSRYFGGKEQLFREALRGDKKPMLEGVDRVGLADHLASMLLEDIGADGEDPSAHVDRLLILLRSSSSPMASEIVREAIHEDVLEPMANLLEGEDAEMRASLSLAVLMGSGILRSAMGVDPMCHGNNAKLRERLIALFSVALGGAVLPPG
ncbi:TetR/AcrR family transcriptional regulator [Sphingomonas sp. M1-B02]|uniref:TetR/AcrR family transcriptional regulator n=1 Tax=Sphingomonas sp. M1-B02 TaxID=3114300 RepID=UPI00223EFD5D|nr:TetR/AcrR family transcriptional regulator [Sphingomonas sp. S6-11]UZK66463.1 TetR/AcrR family transcriptional regulator [Sphingomonas sp. S6-11]